MCAMDISQEKITWVTTNDNHLVEINQHIAAQCALLTKNDKNSKNNPLPICISKKDLDFFCRLRMSSTLTTQDLYDILQPEPYCVLIDVAEKLDAQNFYTELVNEVLKNKDDKYQIKSNNAIVTYVQ